MSFLIQHLGNQILSPVVLEKIGIRFRWEVVSFAETN